MRCGLATRVALALGILFPGAVASRADEVADFYRGKSISIIVSTDAGGG